MRYRAGPRRPPWAISIAAALALALLAPAVALSATLKPKLLAKVSYASTPIGFARTADGNLHVAFETNVNWGDSASGVGAVSISPTGHVGPQVQALAWPSSPGAGSPSGIPGLAVLPSGELVAVFGGSPSGDDGPWGIGSTNGGASWTAPADVGSGTMEFGDSNVSLAVSNGNPVFSAGCCGGIVIQQGLAAGAPTDQITNATDGSAGNTDLAVDGAGGAVVAGWDSNDGTGGVWLQQVAPTQGTAVKMPVPMQYGTGQPPIVAGRTAGPGVFGAYPANFGTTSQMRLLRYGGGSVAVGSVKGLHAGQWGAMTGPDGRIWVVWAGQINGKGVIAVTRSNAAVTGFEPIQTFDFTWSFLFTLSGDGRLGPLDLLISGTPAVKTGQATGGIYYAHLFAELSADLAVKKAGAGKFAVKAKVTDAGDPVKGATVTIKGKTATTNAGGVAKVTISGSARERVTAKVSASGYPALKRAVTL
jgi:hypothetical protein